MKGDSLEGSAHTPKYNPRRLTIKGFITDLHGTSHLSHCNAYQFYLDPLIV